MKIEKEEWERKVGKMGGRGQGKGKIEGNRKERSGEG